MQNLDERFEERINEIENGEPLEQVLRKLSPDEKELVPLLGFVDHARKMQHPSLELSRMNAQQNEIVRQARFARAQAQAPARRAAWGLSSQRSRTIGMLAALAVVMVLAVSGILAALAGPADAHQATVADVQGVAEVAAPGSGEWQPVTDGVRVQAGSQMRTRGGSSASLVFYDGSRTTLGADAAVTLNTVSGGWGKTLKVEIQQSAGETSNNVVPFTSSASFFRVLTPAGQAAVHGTIFRVDVDPMDGARFAVDRGVVWVRGVKAEVTLTAGQVTHVDRQGDPQTPGYEFFVQGSVEKIDGDLWTVAGTSFKVPASVPVGDIHLNDTVNVQGHILADGAYVADRIDLSYSNQLLVRFTGKVQSMTSDAWTIGGKKIAVDADTRIGPGIQVNDPVRVTVSVQADGAWLAKEIQSLLENEEPTATPTLSETPTATSTLPTETPTGTLTQTDTPTGTLTVTLNVTPTPVPTEGARAGCEVGDRQQPEGARLALAHNVAYSDIMSWFCQGYGFGEIDLAYDLSASSHRPVKEIFDLRKSGLGWGQIKKQVEISSTPVPQVKATSAPTAKDKDNHGNGNSNGNGNSGNGNSNGNGNSGNGNSNGSGNNGNGKGPKK